MSGTAMRQTLAAAPRVRRGYATSAPAAAAATVIGTPVVRRPVGAFRGGIAGFALGFGAAAAYGYYYLLQEYHAASNIMLTTVEELQSSTQKISAQLAKVNKLEADLQALAKSASTKDDAGKSKSELMKAHDGLHEDVLAIKNRLWGVEKDVNSALKSVQARGVVGGGQRQV